MIRIAYCDDDLAVLQQIGGLLDQYQTARNRQITGVAFHSPLDLMAEIEKGIRFDVLFLDILMPGENGIETAAEIRRHDSSVKIIFLTSSPEYAVQSYAVNAYYYQLKPIWEDSFFRLLDMVLATCEEEHTDSLILRCKTGITRIEPWQVEYCEVIHRTLFIHLVSGQTLESIGKLDDLCNLLLPHGGFLRPHRSYLINLAHVQSISYRAITMACLAEIPIPRGKYNEIKNAFLAHAFEKKQVML